MVPLVSMSTWVSHLAGGVCSQVSFRALVSSLAVSAHNTWRKTIDQYQYKSCLHLIIFNILEVNSLSYSLFCFQPGVVCTYCYDPRDDTGVLKDTCEHTPGATCETHVDILMRGKIGD